jgi:geranylgeranyl pyrophosphate synthase
MPDAPLACHDQAVLDQCVVVELLHRASLVADDVVDLDLRRAGRPNLNGMVGARRAAIMAHLLVAEALDLADRTGDGVTRQLALRCYRDMSVGELADVQPGCWGDDLWVTYRDVALKKTIAPFQLAFRLAAVADPPARLADADVDEAGALWGSVYQMANDIHQTLGPTGGARAPAVPRPVELNLLTAIASASDPEIDGALRRTGQAHEPSLPERIRASVGRREVVERARAAIAEHKARLADCLEGFPPRWTSLLGALCDEVDTPGWWTSDAGANLTSRAVEQAGRGGSTCGR